MDAEYRPKPAFKTLKELIKGEWMTAPFTTRTNEDGEIAFRGFYGEYEVTQRVPGQRHRTGRFHLAENQENVWTFTSWG